MTGKMGLCTVKGRERRRDEGWGGRERDRQRIYVA
jgi:hypothetical protein